MSSVDRIRDLAEIRAKMTYPLAWSTAKWHITEDGECIRVNTSVPLFDGLFAVECVFLPADTIVTDDGTARDIAIKKAISDEVDKSIERLSAFIIKGGYNVR